MIKLLYLCLVILSSIQAVPVNDATAQSMPGDQLAQSLRNNVVRISALGVVDRTEWRQDGFGFIVGDRGTRILIATANHVVRARQPGARTTAVTVTFFEDQGRTYPADLLGTHDEVHDLAVLEARLPAGAHWATSVLSAHAIVRGQPVWYVGRGQSWYVPTLPGRINSITLDSKILVDGLNLEVGTSGAPLISDSGIVGLLVEDSSGAASRAVPMDIVRRAFEMWNLPWGIVTTSAPPTSSQPAPRPIAPQPPQRPPRRVEHGDLTFEADSCTRERTAVTCSVLVTSHAKLQQRANLCNSYVLDNLSKQYGPGRAMQVLFGPGTCAGQLEPELPVRISIAVKELDPTAASVTLVLRDGSWKASAILRDLTIRDHEASSRTSPPIASQPSHLPLRRVEHGDLTFEADSCTRERTAVTCSVLVTSHAKLQQRVNLCYSYVLDNLSKQYGPGRAMQVLFGPGTCAGQLEPELPVRISIAVKELDPTAASVTLILRDGSWKASAILRDLTIR